MIDKARCEVDAYGVYRRAYSGIAIQAADQRRSNRGKRSPFTNPFPLQISGVRFFRIRSHGPFLPLRTAH